MVASPALAPTTETALIVGCGYVGRAIARCWRDAGLVVTGTTTQSEKLAELAAHVDRPLQLDATDPAALAVALAGQHTVLLCLGAKGPDRYEQTYQRAAEALATVLPQVPEVQQVIYTGSYALYGDQGGAWVDETTPPRPANRNGEILHQTEEILLGAMTASQAVCVFRLGGICGPGREVHQIFRRAAGTTRPGSGEDWSNWIHLEDIVGAIDFARRRRLRGIFNLVHEEPLQQKELLDRALSSHGLEPVRWNPAEASARPYNARVSNRKLREAGYSFIHRAIPL